MSLETAINKTLLKIPALVSIVADRIYPLEIEQGQPLPAVTYQRAGGSVDYDMDGSTGLVESRFFVFLYGVPKGRRSGYLVAKDMRKAVVEFLSRRPGYSDKVGEIEIQSIFINDEDDRRLDSVEKKGVVRVMLDLTIWHRTAKEGIET